MEGLAGGGICGKDVSVGVWWKENGLRQGMRLRWNTFTLHGTSINMLRVFIWVVTMRKKCELQMKKSIAVDLEAVCITLS